MKTMTAEAVAAMDRRAARQIRMNRVVERRGSAIPDCRDVSEYCRLGDMVSLDGEIIGRACHYTIDGVAVRLMSRGHTTAVSGKIVVVSHIELFRVDFAVGRATAEAIEVPF